MLTYGTNDGTERTTTGPKSEAALLATKIADDLFKNGAGCEAIRLILDMGGMDGGGWCKSAVVDRVADIIQAHNDKLTP